MPSSQLVHSTWGPEILALIWDKQLCENWKLPPDTNKMHRDNLPLVGAGRLQSQNFVA